MKGRSSGRLTIGLFNTYDRWTLREPHRRALARAATIADAFDWNLAVFGFPFPSDLSTSEKIVDWLRSTTSIGEAGKYAIELSDAGRLLVFDLPKKGFPPQLGTLLIASRKPVPGRALSAETIAEKVAAGESFLVLFGLGPKGLPSSLFGIAEYFFDVTGRHKSLETCTAIGAVVGSISTALKLLSDKCD